MISFRLKTAATLLAMLACLSAGADPWIAPREGVVLLRNGHVLQGTVTREGDRYRIILGPSSEIRLPTSEIVTVAKDMAGVYQVKRAAVRKGDFDGHLQLAAWCLRHELETAAADQLLKAAALKPSHPAVAQLERQLKQRIQHPDQTAPAAQDDASQSTRADIEQQLRSVPQQAVDSFVHQVQPLLLNRCSATGCHGLAGTSDFRLLSSPWGPASRTLTQRNLHEILRQIDWKSPADSPLLKAASSIHGPLKAPPLDRQDERNRQQLVAWVNHVASAAGAEPKQSEDSAIETLPKLGTQGGLPGEASPLKEKKPLPQSNVQTSKPPVNEDTARVSPRHAALPKAFQPRDAFDAEIFNRKYFKRSPPGGQQHERAPALPR